MKYLILLSALILSACSTTVPVTAKFPDPPGKNAMERCLDLKKLSDTPTLSEISKTVSTNYGTYYECAVKSDSWIEWYQVQKHIFENIVK